MILLILPEKTLIIYFENCVLVKGDDPNFPRLLDKGFELMWKPRGPLK